MDRLGSVVFDNLFYVLHLFLEDVNLKFCFITLPITVISSQQKVVQRVLVITLKFEIPQVALSHGITPSTYSLSTEISVPLCTENFCEKHLKEGS